MFKKNAAIFRLAGFNVRVDLSWVFIALLIAWSLAQGVFPEIYEGFPPVTYWWMALAAVIGLFFSLILHELSHSLVARRYGLQISGITLFVFGGVAEMEEEPANPRAEFLMAIAGPLASLALATALRVFAEIGGALEVSSPLLGVARYLAFLNGLLAVFNLIPAFPLDGGRIFRAALWYWRKDLLWATRVASGAGAAFGFLMMAFGILSAATGNFVGGVWWFLIGLFLRGSAAASYHQVAVRCALEGKPVSRFMTPDPVTVSPVVSLRDLVENYVYRYHHEFFPVVEDSQLLGCVSTRQIKDVPRERWDVVTVRAILVPCSKDNRIEFDQSAVKALQLMQRTGAGRLMVTDRGRLVGVIALKDLLKLLALKIELKDLDQ